MPEVLVRLLCHTTYFTFTLQLRCYELVMSSCRFAGDHRIRTSEILSYMTACPAHQVLAEWWYRNSPVVVELIRKYGGILMAFLVPFTPGAARQAGYREASHGALRALDNLDTRLPGGGRGWSKRWLSRPRGHKESSSWDKFAIDGQVGGVGVATTAVVFAAGTRTLRACGSAA